MEYYSAIKTNKLQQHTNILLYGRTSKADIKLKIYISKRLCYSVYVKYPEKVNLKRQ